MADGVTPILGLVKPEVGASSDTWGGKDNANCDVLDALFQTGPLMKVANGGTGVGSYAALKTALALGGLAYLNAIGTGELVDGSVTAAKLAAGLVFPAGTRMTFQQTAAPTGWTKDTTHNDKAFRVVSGAVVNGGSSPFSTVMASRTPTGTNGATTAAGTIAGTALTIAQLPVHGHPHAVATTAQSSPQSQTTGGMMLNTLGSVAEPSYTGAVDNTAGHQIGGEGGGATHTHTFTGTSHNHTFSGTAMDFAVAYVDLIIASKD